VRRKFPEACSYLERFNPLFPRLNHPFSETEQLFVQRLCIRTHLLPQAFQELLKLL